MSKIPVPAVRKTNAINHEEFHYVAIANTIEVPNQALTRVGF